MLVLAMVTSGFAELLSLGAVLPFLAVLSDPVLLWQQPQVQQFAIAVGFTSSNQLLLPASLTFALTAVLAALVRLMNLWLNVRLAAAVGSDLSCEAYQRTLYQPYSVHVQRNSAAVITGITNHIALTVNALNNTLQLTTSAVVAAALLTGLLVIDAPIALCTAALFGGAYGVLAITTRRELTRNGKKIAEASTHQIKALQEGLGAIRDVLLDGNQSTYLQIYRQADHPQRKLQSKNGFLAAFPRYALEGLGMVAIALLGGILVSQRGSGGAVIPLLGAMALGAQRLLPALQQVYGGWASLNTHNAALEGVLEILSQPLPLYLSKAEPLQLQQGIRFERVHFRYQPDQPDVLRGLNMEIRLGESIGLIGSTGSGKSTTVDLLMGLLLPTAGRVLIDGVDLHDPYRSERLAAWRAAIAHVPQSIYLADSSIAENIAFGVRRHQIDLARVKQAAAQAQIASFIETTSEGYETFVGERGIRLSGGQRQRIGIARALYKGVKVLILDEATSALDIATEQALMDSVNKLSKELTIIMIAHRLSTVQHCDRIIRLAEGAVSVEGPPHYVLSDSA